MSKNSCDSRVRHRSCCSRARARARDTHPEHDVKSKDHVLEAAAHLAGIPSVLPHGGHGWETFIYRSCELLAYVPHRHNTPRTDGKRVATTEGITEPPRRQRGDTLYNSYTTRGKTRSTPPTSWSRERRHGQRRDDPCARGLSFSLYLDRLLFRNARARLLSLSLSLLGSVDQLITATHRTAITTAAIVTSRRALLAAGSTRLPASRDHRLPSLPPALHFACSATPGDLPFFSRHPLPPPLLGISCAPTFGQSRWLLSLSFTRNSPPCDRLPLVSPPYLTASPSDPSLPLPGTALSMYRGSTCLALSELTLVSRVIICTNGIKNYSETKYNCIYYFSFFQ